MNLAGTPPDLALENGLFNVANTPTDLDWVVRAIDALVNRAGLANADAETALRNVLSNNNFYGAYLELAAYEWFDARNVQFAAQQTLSGQDILKPNGAVLDGQFQAVDCFFDIKAMGFQERVGRVSAAPGRKTQWTCGFDRWLDERRCQRHPNVRISSTSSDQSGARARRTFRDTAARLDGPGRAANACTNIRSNDRSLRIGRTKPALSL
jgi:hypothetical protein